MITLITGGPGLGKTAFAVKLLSTQYQNRPIFTNIRGLTLDHSPLPKLEDWTQHVLNDQGTSEHIFTFPAGSIVVIDECQQFFRPRPNGSKVPPYISAFETHRHRGIDFILITQGTRLVDLHLKSLVKGGLHIFLKSSYVGRYRYEKSECIDEDSKASYSLATRRKYKLPKEVFKLYKSSELHTKPPRAKLPLAAYVVIVAVIVSAGLAYRAQGRFTSVINPDKTEKLEAGAKPANAQRLTSAAPTLPPLSLPVTLTESMTPVDPDDPLSAPIYAEAKPKATPPTIVGCIASKNTCTCYTQQNTTIWIPQVQCRTRAAGNYYDPYQIPPPDGSNALGFQTTAKQQTRPPPEGVAEQI